jgi:hypothetical protein
LGEGKGEGTGFALISVLYQRERKGKKWLADEANKVRKEFWILDNCRLKER